MKIRLRTSNRPWPFLRRRKAAAFGDSSGILLVECLVYFAVFALLTGVAMGAFYLCWNNTKALTGATDDIRAALRAGERWRTDVRGATGKISVTTSPAGEQVRIPRREGAVVYRFESGAVRRETTASPGSQLLLPKVRASAMRTEARGGVTAWRWELALVSRRPETQLPLLFTFETAQTNP
jgi:hypothetical protein